MSQSTTNNAYMEKSMNGIISIDDGAGGSMEGGIITCTELDVPIINVNEVQPYDASVDYALFTNSTRPINIGNAGVIANMLSPIYSTQTIVAGQFNATQAYLTNLDSVTINVSTINVSSVNVSSVIIGTETTDNILATSSSTTANLYTNVSTGIINIGTSQWTGSNINIGKQGEVNFSNSTLNIAGGANISNLFCDNFRHEVYGTNVSLLLEEFGAGRSVQMGNVSNPLIIYAPTTIVDTLKAQTIISPNPTILSTLFTNNTSGNVSIATSLTTGILTLGNAGVVNIKGSSVNISTLNTSTLNVSTINTNIITATNTSSNAVIYNNITTGSVQLASNASSIAIGSNASSITIGSSANYIGIGTTSARTDIQTLRFIGNEIVPLSTGSAFIIGGGNMSTTQILAIGTSQENVYFGSTAANANMFVGDFRFTNDTMNLMIGSAPNVSGIMKIGDTLTTGSLQLGTGLTTGNVSIGNNAMSGNITLRTTGALLLGNSAGSIELGTTSLITNNINLGNVSTTFNINSSTINLSSRFLNIGAIAVSVNIGTQVSTANNITLGNVSTNLNFNASTISIGTTVNSNAITIGNISTVQLGIKSPINPDYDTKYVADVGTPSGCLGNYFIPTLTAGSGLATNVPTQAGVFTNLPIGVWQINWLQTMNATTSVVITTLTMNIGSTSMGSDFLTNIVETNRTLAAGSTRMYATTYTFVNLLSTNDVYCSVIATFTGTFLKGSNNIDTFKIIRLA